MDLFQKKPPLSPKTALVKEWVTEIADLDPDKDTVLVTELRCSEPGCPPLETVIAILSEDASRRQVKIHCAIVDLDRDQVETAWGRIR